VKTAAVWTFVALAAALSGCGTETVLLGSAGAHLLTAEDALALPGEQIELHARVRVGDLLQGQPGLVVRFSRDGAAYRAAQTDSDGVATVTFTPPAPGNYVLTVEVSPIGMPGRPPPPQKLLVACRRAETRMVVVDLDKTLVGSGFEAVLIGDPKPMPDSPAVMRKLARDETIVYLTHRPDVFGPMSKAWLVRNQYPPGPVLLSTVGEFIRGSGAYKAEMLRRLRRRFKKIDIGIGDKVSDALAYHANGLKALLIVKAYEDDRPDALDALAKAIRALPAEVDVVGSWRQIDKAIFGGVRYPAAAAAKRLEAIAKARRAEARTRPAPTEEK